MSLLPAGGGDSPAFPTLGASVRTHRHRGVVLALAAATVLGLVAGWWTPRGPVSATQALSTMAMALATGMVAGVAVRSRWTILITPAVFLVTFETVRIASVGPTVDVIDVTGFYGIGALTVGRLVHGVLAVLPMMVGVVAGRSWARHHDPGRPALVPRRGRLTRAVGRAGAAAVSLGLLLLAAAILRPASTTVIVGPDGHRLPGSVAELARVPIRGHDQTMLIRGRSARNPVLLFLAGGPGGFEIGTMSRHGRLLERDFVVVTWEQRGTGKSYGSFEPGSTLTVDGAVADTIAVTEYLRARFHTGKIYLVGNSYGTLLGVRAAQQRPELYAALVGTGQMVDVAETDRIFYRDTLAHAQTAGDTALVDALRSNGEPPYADLRDYLPLVAGERQWNDYSGIPGFPGLREPPDHLAVREYTLLDQVRSLTGLIDSHALLYPQLQDVDLRIDAPRLYVPVYLMQGRHEARGRAQLAEDWFARLEAPSKQMFTFEYSGHRPFAQEPARFHQLMTSAVLAETWTGPLPAPAVAGPAQPADDLLGLFARYNPAVWPGHLLAYALVLLAAWSILRRPGRTADRLTAGLLAATWLWLGVVFHGMYAAQSAPASSAGYATLFVLQAALFVRAGLLRHDLVFTRGRGAAGWIGWFSIGYALLVHPLIGLILGHGYPEAPLFGMAPCPTAIATFGLLLLVRPPLPRHLLIIPMLWAITAPLAAVGRGVYEDVYLSVAGLLAVTLVLVRDRRRRATPAGEITSLREGRPRAG